MSIFSSSALLLLASGGIGGGLIGYAIGNFRGIQRGREIARCEPPTHGEFHFNDGPITELHGCTSPTSAIEKLLEAKR